MKKQETSTRRQDQKTPGNKSQTKQHMEGQVRSTRSKDPKASNIPTDKPDEEIPEGGVGENMHEGEFPENLGDVQLNSGKKRVDE